MLIVHAEAEINFQHLHAVPTYADHQDDKYMQHQGIESVLLRSRCSLSNRPL